MSEEITKSSSTIALEPLLKVDDVIRILNVSRSYAYKLMKCGDIPTINIGGSVRVHPRDLEKYIASKVSGSDKRNSFSLGRN